MEKCMLEVCSVGADDRDGIVDRDIYGNIHLLAKRGIMSKNIKSRQSRGRTLL